MRKESIELFKTLNAEMREFQKAGVELPNEIKKYQLKVNQFYERNKLNVVNDQFTIRAKLTHDQENELVDIAKAMTDDNNVHFLTDYKNILETNKMKRFGATDLDSLIKRMDFLANEQSEVLIKNSLSSSQILEVYTWGKNKNLSDEQIDKLVLDKIKTTGLTGSSLHKSIYKSIKRKKLGKGVQKNLGTAKRGKQRPSINGSKQKQGRGLKTLYGIDNED